MTASALLDHLTTQDLGTPGSSGPGTIVLRSHNAVVGPPDADDWLAPCGLSPRTIGCIATSYAH